MLIVVLAAAAGSVSGLLWFEAVMRCAKQLAREIVPSFADWDVRSTEARREVGAMVLAAILILGAVSTGITLSAWAIFVLVLKLPAIPFALASAFNALFSAALELRQYRKAMRWLNRADDAEKGGR